MKRTLRVMLSAIALFALSSLAHAATTRAKWTVMVYMTANNNLEADAIADFNEMAAVTDSTNVRVVVQMKRANEQLLPSWKGTRRYLVTRKEKLDDPSKISDLGDVDMADSHTLADFISWATVTYPADRYALVIWSHGAGWKDIVLGSTAAPVPAGTTAGPAPAPTPAPPKVTVPSGIADSSYKASSQDGSDQLYNAELACAIRYAMGGQKLDLLAFDSCLMAMMETAYAMRNVAGLMVGSEELVPRYGLNYNTLLTALTQRQASMPTVTAFDVAQMMIDTYKAEYTTGTIINRNPRITLSAIDLTAMPALTSAVSSLARALQSGLPGDKTTIQQARAACSNLAPPDPNCTVGMTTCQSAVFHHIDLKRFAAQIVTATTDAALKSAATDVIAAVDLAVGTRTFAGADRIGGTYGASGLAIYFPANGISYTRDPFNDQAYDKPASNLFLPYPPEFVGDQRWADFLHAYYQVVP